MGKKKGGRPSKYRDEFAGQAFQLCLLGATDAELATFFDVSESTLNNWKAAHPAFLESLKEGKLEADAMVAERLFRLATGYDYSEQVAVGAKGIVVTVQRHQPPHPTAAIFWLKNRRPTQWRDKHEVEVEATVNVKDAREAARTKMEGVRNRLLEHTSRN